ncbi:MAG: hypothetical protein WD995_13110 [Gemmatimonadota bacterium]
MSRATRVMASRQGRVTMAILAVLPVGGGCGGQPSLPDVFGPAPIAYADTLPIAEPAEVAHSELSALMKASVKDEVGRALSVRRRISGSPEALNVTSMDDVVGSSWFEPRITARPMSPASLAHGPPGADPDTAFTLTVVGAKVGGVSPGFTVRDRKGDTYLLKFDPVGHPALQSAADVISSRLFWAAGYNVPRDVVIAFDRADLDIAPGTTIETVDGPRPMRTDDVDEILRQVDALPSGRYRALASLFVPGTPKGPFRFEGTRHDDPNDYYPHEHRRELRGLWVLAAWTEHVDLRFQNTLDVWIENPGYLAHYLIDFGATLGSRSIRIGNAREGREYSFDLGASLARMATLGLYRVGWEGTNDDPMHPSIGWIATKSFDPAGWKPFWPNRAYRNMTARDGYWGAKLVGAFTRSHLEAAVAEARYPDAAAAEEILDILEYRQEKVLRHWYGQVAPVEHVTVRLEPGSDAAAARMAIGFQDLGLTGGLWSAAETRYSWRLVDERGRVLYAGEVGAMDEASQTIRVSEGVRSGSTVPTSGARYLTLKLSTVRPGASDRSARITLVPDGSGFRVAGLVH